ncbi:PspC domain-containing protein [Nitriliruptoraceae bacterium ZYF776]|nr:PspC domain-containing protein [Profundirhabdus halotolerans]
MIAGVAGGLGRQLGVDPVIVRIGFVVLSLAGGAGVVAYGVLWAASPDATSTSASPAPRPTVQQAVALALLTLGTLLLLRGFGLWFGDALVWPVTVAAAGSAVVWTRGDADARRVVDDVTRGRLDRSALARLATGSVSPVRVLIGTVLVTVAIAGFLAANDALVAVRDLGLVLLAAAAGTFLLFGPWFKRVLDALNDERRARVRQEERAELAAHLHDSVLQTLALIQRSSDDPRRMVSLARVQERDLRAWLYGSGRLGSIAVTLTDAVEAVAAEVETLHHLAVDAVVVGDAPVGDGTRALLGAVREACVNAAKHAGVDEVSVYVEVVDDEGDVTAFVRDRGHGFDVDAEMRDGDPHRRGLRDSIVGRLERHGGRAQIWSAPGAGTEVELTVPRDPPATTPDTEDEETPT